MRIGLSTPAVIRVPGVASAWESDAEVEQVATIVAQADALGFDHVTCSEHVGVPVDQAPGRGSTYWDPLATLSFLAARTRRIRLVTAVLVLPYHHPLAVVKRYGTLDWLSGGRVVLGVGVGSLQEEFGLLGASWADRGRVTDERLAEIRAAWGRPEHDGFVIDPQPVQEQVPLWVGGRIARSLRRATSLGTGWMPFGLTRPELAELLDAAELPVGFEVVLSTGRALDPLGDRDRAARALEALAAVGATTVTAAVSATSADHYGDQLAALMSLARETTEVR